MLYKRSSFLRLLKKKHECDIKPLENGTVIRIENGPVHAYIHLNNKDRIDYDEIWVVCRKLYIELPGASELEESD
jgi:hypothetical protein